MYAQLELNLFVHISTILNSVCDIEKLGMKPGNEATYILSTCIYIQSKADYNGEGGRVSYSLEYCATAVV